MIDDLTIYSTHYGISAKELLEFVETILIYKFPKMTRKEVLDMLGHNHDELKDTQYFKDVMTEGRQKGRQEGEKLFFKKMLVQRFGKLPNHIENQLQDATEAQLEKWSQAIFTAKQLSDIFPQEQKH